MNRKSPHIEAGDIGNMSVEALTARVISFRNAQIEIQLGEGE